MKRGTTRKPQRGQISRLLGRCEASKFRFKGGRVRPGREPQRPQSGDVPSDDSRSEERTA